MTQSTFLSPNHVYIASDHGGFELKEELKEWLRDARYSVEDLGPHVSNTQVDYPRYAFAVSEKVVSNNNSLGLLLCRSGGGMTIAANKVKGVRAVDLTDVKSARHAREHNHANVIVIGADWLTYAEAKEIIRSFLSAFPSQEERHLRRISQIKEYEGSLL